MKKDLLKGKSIHLKPATLRNRRAIYNWMVNSDITPQMFGPPNFPDLEAPDWEEFLEDYTENYFTDNLPLKGRCFIIKKGKKHLGQINYNPIDVKRKFVELDIWLANKSVIGKGYGREAMVLLCNYLHQQFSCESFFVQPSARNAAAIKVYQKVGFKIVQDQPKGMEKDYNDSVFMIKKL